MHAQQVSLTLKKDIAAIQVVAGGNGRWRIGTCLPLAKGSRLEICGQGFSDATMMVRTADARYYVLRNVVR